MALIEVKVPDIGDFKDVAVIELLVKPGDTVAAEQSLITVESDKASMEIPSSHAGTVKELKLALGDKVNQGSLILTLEAEGAVAAPPAQPTAPESASRAPHHREVRRGAGHADPRVADLEHLQVRLVAMAETRVTEGDQRVGGDGHGAALAGHHDGRHLRGSRDGSPRAPGRGTR
jgi:pyruvate/2-oxoglutarate dehydrogenase complex dihydrolipoamide acyltransferase (E2) component